MLFLSCVVSSIAVNLRQSVCVDLLDTLARSRFSWCFTLAHLCSVLCSLHQCSLRIIAFFIGLIRCSGLHLRCSCTVFYVILTCKIMAKFRMCVRSWGGTIEAIFWKKVNSKCSEMTMGKGIHARNLWVRLCGQHWSGLCANGGGIRPWLWTVLYSMVK